MCGRSSHEKCSIQPITRWQGPRPMKSVLSAAARIRRCSSAMSMCSLSNCRYSLTSKNSDSAFNSCGVSKSLCGNEISELAYPPCSCGPACPQRGNLLVKWHSLACRSNIVHLGTPGAQMLWCYHGICCRIHRVALPQSLPDGDTLGSFQHLFHEILCRSLKDEACFLPQVNLRSAKEIIQQCPGCSLDYREEFCRVLDERPLGTRQRMVSEAHHDWRACKLPPGLYPHPLHIHPVHTGEASSMKGESVTEPFGAFEGRSGCENTKDGRYTRIRICCSRATSTRYRCCTGRANGDTRGNNPSTRRNRPITRR